MSRLGLYFHTLRYLRPLQIAARLRTLLRKPLRNHQIDLRPAPNLRPMPFNYVPPISLASCMRAPDTFRFLNVERQCSSAADWNPPEADKLWTYNLHYFDDLNAADAESRRACHKALMARWVEENPPGRGIGWDPYPTSKRIVNWVKWSARGNVLPEFVVSSLAVQSRWLANNLEYHILGNHLLTNAKALVYAGAYFTGDEAQRWYAAGMAVLEQELSKQVLPDGGHFELSPMYHALMLEDVLDLINLHKAYDLPAHPRWRESVDRMMRWLQVMNHPDGDIPFFNDSAFDIAPRYDDLIRYCESLGLRTGPLPAGALVALRDSGYIRIATGRAYLICDCAEVGAAYQPGHGHADTLSFEFSLDCQRVFVNSGTSLYGVGPERQQQRSTAAHNTVVVDAADSSEVWAGFRVARRAKPTIHEIGTDERRVVDASHDGYSRLPGRNEHRRRWELLDSALHIEDWVSGPFRSAHAFFHLHPDIETSVAAGQAVVLSRSGNPVAWVEFDGADALDIVLGYWHPAFGVSRKNRCIRASFSGEKLVTRVRWTAHQ